MSRTFREEFMVDEPEEVSSQQEPARQDAEPTTNAPATKSYSNAGAGKGTGSDRTGRAASTVVAGSGRPANYTDKDCEDWWMRLLAGETTLAISKDLGINQATILLGIRYIAATLQDLLDESIRKTELFDYNRSLRQSLQLRLDESVGILETIDGALALLAPDRKLPLELPENIRQYQSLLASRQYEVKSQLAVIATIMAAQKDYSELLGIRKTAAAARSVNPAGKRGTLPTGNTIPPPSGGITALVEQLSKMPEDKIREVAFAEEQDEGDE